MACVRPMLCASVPGELTRRAVVAFELKAGTCSGYLSVIHALQAAYAQKTADGHVERSHKRPLHRERPQNDIHAIGSTLKRGRSASSELHS
jgi:hypothetical protein